MGKNNAENVQRVRMDKKITVSIITVCYNHAKGLEHTMRSVLEQTYDSIEYIVIDGGSTDGSRDLIEKYQEKLAYWCSEKDNGIYDAMNKGLAKAKGEYCLFLNAGDYLKDRHVLSDVFVKKHDADLLIGRQLHVDEKGRTSKSPKLHYDDFNMGFFLSSTLPHQSTFIRRSLLIDLGGYDEEYKVSADWVFWVKAVVLYGCSIELLTQSVSYMEAGGVSSNMDKCHADMSKYLEKLLIQKNLKWDGIFELALKARAQDFCTRNSLLHFISKAIIKIGKKI